MYANIRYGVEPNTHRQHHLRLKQTAREFDEARTFQSRMLANSSLVLDVRPDFEFPTSLEGTVVFANSRFIVVEGAKYLSLVHHDGSHPSVGSDVEVRWRSATEPVSESYGHPRTSWRFSWTERVKKRELPVRESPPVPGRASGR